ncbi:acylneuraminate cytidylyltransferase family protein [Gelidibacter maritimus]|uniref:Acylneuraminate cytidylyltransferase family protein n=1 Tax=Gelidibacter maritimus TaxID=2761487 RepID=A0A7W2R434_9FLAO|nr:acylneuraminate cytidylyltransferase family protein [Gelidibacter maritimus]MBA6152650.1 acylneuraminate cytidylyltransferase family protein [Gelidibacter maritimus]
MIITALIPARKNSERFPGKNYTPFLGKPLFMHSVDFAKESDLITDYFVTTNDEIIIAHCEASQIPYILRPDIYCQPTSDSASFVAHFLKRLINNQEKLPDAVLVLQPTDPVRQHSFLKEMIQLYHSKSADCVFTVVQCKTKMGQIIDGVFEPYNYRFGQRFQDIDHYYEEKGLLYLINVSSFLKNNSFFGQKNIPYIRPEYYRNMDIDTKFELDIAELTFKTFISQ